MSGSHYNSGTSNATVEPHEQEPRLVSLKELGLIENSALPWYRRRGWTLTWGILGLVAVAVVLDYPHLASKPQSVSDGLGLVQSAAADIAPCGAAVTNAVEIYRTVGLGHPTAQQRGETPRLLQDDLTACSFADSSAYDLATLSVPRTLVNTPLTHLSTTLTAWAAPHGTAAVSDIVTLIRRPGNTVAKADLATQANTLDSLRLRANAQLGQAGALLKEKMPPLNLPVVNNLLDGKTIPKSS